MIRWIRGNLLEADVEALVNPVNTVGVMGKGLALQFKRAFPKNFEVYQAACQKGELDVGQMLTVRLEREGNPRDVVNFPTKKHWKGKSRLEYVTSGLAALVAEIRRLGIRSIAVPPLGCGLGGLSWPQVRDEVQNSLGRLDGVDVLVFEPAGWPGASGQASTRSTVPSSACAR